MTSAPSIRLASFLALLAATAACSSPDAATRSRIGPASCEVPAPTRVPGAKLVPDAFVLDKSRLTDVTRFPGGFTARIVAPYSLERALERYREVVVDGGYEIIGEDNEGFEAELFLERGAETGMVQVTATSCDDAIVAYVKMFEIGERGAKIDK